MKVKLSALAVFLLVGALFHCAHARATPPNLEADSDHIARRNLVCVELQRFQLGGPGCGPKLQAAVIGQDEPWIARSETATPLLTRRQMQKVCPVLCRNEVGRESCACKYMQAPNWVGSSKQPNSPIDVDDVCGAFCRESVPLGGCSCLAVSLDRVLPKIRLANRADVTTTTETVETTTEPDWANVCLALCQIGEGGALCNCDKPPFVK